MATIRLCSHTTDHFNAVNVCDLMRFFCDFNKNSWEIHAFLFTFMSID